MNIDCTKFKEEGSLRVDGVLATEYFKDRLIDYKSNYIEITEKNWAYSYTNADYDRVFSHGSAFLDMSNPYYKPEQYFSGLGLQIVDHVGGSGWGAIFCKNIK